MLLIKEFFKFETIEEICRLHSIPTKKTVINLFKIMRALIKEDLDSNLPMLGGEGVVVQADETLLFKQKHHVGRMPRQHWVAE
jgi:hypothetical protein